MAADATRFDVKPREAIANLRSKTPTPTERWDDLAGPVHGQSFAVAGATSVDLVRDLHDSMSSAIENGTTLTDFRKDFDQIVARHGWSYKGSRGWRTQLIYRCNMRSAHMAGQWSKLWANRERQQYLMYVAVLDNRTRPEHRAWHGLVLPITDPFWKTHYGPNGWNCRCGVIAYSKRDLQHKGQDVDDSPPVEYRDVTDADGEIVDRVPKGIDPGWDHNVGQSWLQPEVALGQKLATMPVELAATAADKAITPAYQEVLNDRWQDWYAAAKTERTAGSDSQIVGFLGNGIVGGMRRQVQSLQSVTVGVFDRNAVQLDGMPKTGATHDEWPQQWIDALPTLVRNYQAALWDTGARRLVVVPKGSLNGSLATITIKPDTTWGDQTVAAVTALGTAKPQDLRQSRYVLLDGRVSDVEAGANGI